MLSGRPPPVLSREELDAEKQELAAIDARPIKKIAEAKARKKRRLAVRQCCAALSKLLGACVAARLSPGLSGCTLTNMAVLGQLLRGNWLVPGRNNCKWWRNIAAQVSLEKARQKSEAIVNQEDVPMRSRMKEVEKVYAKARAAGKGSGKKKQTRSAKEASSRKGRPLDRRMMSDKRELNSKRKKAASKKRTKGKKPGGGGGAKGKGGGRR